MSAAKQRRIEQSMVANIALHNVFEVLNPEYIRLKESHEISTDTNSLGVEVYRGLLLLGFWKKVLFVMDYKRSLSLAAYFADYKTYKTIFITKNRQFSLKVACIDAITQANHPDFSWLPFAQPETPSEVHAMLIALEHVIRF